MRQVEFAIFGKPLLWVCQYTVAAIAGLGTIDAYAGATSYASNQTPDPGQTGLPLTCVFQVVGTPTSPQSYRYDVPPPGMKVYQDVASNTPITDEYINSIRVVLKGIPREPGYYSFELTAYKGRDGETIGYQPVAQQFDLFIDGDPLPYDPENFTASQAIARDKVDLAWELSTNAMAYEIWRANENLPLEASLLGTTAGDFFSDTTAAAGMTYYYWIKATGEFGDGLLTGPVVGTTQVIPVPIAPEMPAASDELFSDAIEVTWNPVADSTAYQLWRAETESLSAAVLIGEVNTTTYTDHPLPSGQNYYYWVRAGNSSGYSTFSLPDAGGTKLVITEPTYAFTAYLQTEDHFIYNQCGFTYIGYFPFLYNFSYQNWLYLFPLPNTSSDADGFYLYDFAREVFGFTAPNLYPYYFTLPEFGNSEAVNLNPLNQ